MDSNRTRWERWSDWLALNRTVAVVLATVLFFGLGEQLWETFMPAYLAARTKEYAHTAAASERLVSWQALAIVGLYGSLRILLEAFCYIGGGQLTARLGDRRSLILFALLTITGYLLFLSSPSPLAATVAAMLILGWEPLSVPVTFTTVGSTVAASRQGMAFAIQSIQKRLPKVLGPFIAGWVIGWAQSRSGDVELGRIAGMHMLVSAALGLGVISLLIQFRFMPRSPRPNHSAANTAAGAADPAGSGGAHEPSAAQSNRSPSAWQLVRTMHPTLRRLLAAEIFTRWCDWMVREFVVIYVLVILGERDQYLGRVLVPLQHLVALATYLPIGGMTRRFGLQPFIGLTFIFFALFPLCLAWMPGGSWLILAFVVYGLREIGEPARKALITSLMPESVRARGVGLYWGIRSFAICLAPLAGAAIWYGFGPIALLHTAFALGCVGAAVFYSLAPAPPPP